MAISRKVWSVVVPVLMIFGAITIGTALWIQSAAESTTEAAEADWS